MALPNDVSRAANQLAMAGRSSNEFSGDVRTAARMFAKRSVIIRKPAVDGAANTTTAYTAADQFRAPCAIRVLGAYIMPQAAAVADATNNATVNLVKGDGAAGSATVVASYTSDVAGGSLAAGTTKAMTLSATVANTRLAAGDILSFNITKGGTGVAVPALSITVDYEIEGTDSYTVSG